MQAVESVRKYGRILRAATLRDQPVYAHFGITHRCDITCRMCGIWRFGNEDEEMGLPEIARIADVMRELGVVQVSIGGGEPFTRRDLAEVVHLFRSRELNVRVLTNAMNITEERIREVADAGLEAISVSFDTLSRKRFGWICMDPDAWEKVVRNMILFAELLPKTGNILVMNTVVSKENLLELPDLVRFAGDLGYHHSLIPVELAEDPHDRANKFITHQPKMALSEEERLEVDAVYDKLIQMKKEGASILSTTPYLMASRAYFKTGVFPLPCDAGRLYFSVNPGGMMTICHRGYDRKSMLDADIIDYFRSSAFQDDAKAEADACSGCVRPCWIDTGFMFKTWMGFVETSRINLNLRRERTTLSYEEALARARP